MSCHIIMSHHSSLMNHLEVLWLASNKTDAFHCYINTVSDKIIVKLKCWGISHALISLGCETLSLGSSTLMLQPCVQWQNINSHASLTISCTVDCGQLQWILMISGPWNIDGNKMTLNFRLKSKLKIERCWFTQIFLSQAVSFQHPPNYANSLKVSSCQIWENGDYNWFQKKLRSSLWCDYSLIS